VGKSMKNCARTERLTAERVGVAAALRMTKMAPLRAAAALEKPKWRRYTSSAVKCPVRSLHGTILA